MTLPIVFLICIHFHDTIFHYLYYLYLNKFLLHEFVHDWKSLFMVTSVEPYSFSMETCYQEANQVFNDNLSSRQNN